MSSLRVLETALYVSDLEKAEGFYKDVLGLKLNSKKHNRHLFFHCGDGMLLLFNAKETLKKTGPVPTHGSEGSGHIAFAIEENSFDDWKDKLSNNGVKIEEEVDWPDGGKSIYFRDPSGNSLEFTTPEIWK